jgi:sialic acid synthase SpsE
MGEPRGTLAASFHIGRRAIGSGHPVFVIAEIGVNHDGSVHRAIELVAHAHAAGADAVKLQIFRADTLMHGSSTFAGYQQERCAESSPVAMLRRYELSPGDTATVVREIRSRGMAAIATPFSPADVETIERLDLDAVKIASPDLVNLPLLKHSARCGKPLLVSTGAATRDEVKTAIARLHGLRLPFAMLHCVSSYPADDCDANLCWIGELAALGVVAGYSDHTTDLLTGALAVACGAAVIEKHLTYDRHAAGPDHAASADPAGFASYVRAVRRAELLRGRAGKRVLKCEEDVRAVSRQSLVARVDLPAGVVIQEGDLIVQRPGTGILAGEIEKVVGVSPRASIPAGTMLTWEMLGAPAAGDGMCPQDAAA